MYPLSEPLYREWEQQLQTQEPLAVKAPATNSKALPGKNEVTTKPVSAKIIAKNSTELIDAFN